jgi:hypothetical protein
MMFPPFWRGLTERATKTALQQAASFLFTYWVDHLVALTMTEKVGVYAAGAVGASIISSLLSRRIGPKDSPSLVQEGAGTNRV